MSAPKLFEFPDGSVVDLNQVYAVSRTYSSGSEWYIKVFVLPTPDSPQEFYLGEDRGKAAEEKRSLIATWAQDR